MFKKIIVLNLAFSVFYASDVITIDSLFKKQIGLRSVSSLSYLSSGNAYIYNTYPTLVAQPDTLSWTDTKKLSFNQTFIYTLSSKFDILLSGSGSYNQVVVNTRTRSHRYYSESNPLIAQFCTQELKNLARKQVYQDRYRNPQ